MTNEPQIRSWTPTETEWASATRSIYDAFGEPIQPETADLETQLRPRDRRVAVADGRGIFGGCFAYDFRLSLPGGSVCPVGGLAGVGISPVAKGRGGLRSMMQTHLQQSIALGDAASVLMASESGLYRRYGYGVATEMVQWRLDTRACAFTDTDPVGAGNDIRLMHDRAAAIPILAAIHTQHCSERAMEIVRDDRWWRYMLEPSEPDWVSVGKNKFIAVNHDIEGAPDGYAIYSIDSHSGSHFSHGNANSRVVLTELCCNSVQAEKSLFRYLVTLPWCTQLLWELGPVDPIARHFINDPRQLEQHSRVDMLWLRPLDAARLLTQRGYDSDGRVIIDYSDKQFPQFSGRWLLIVEGGKVRLQPSASDQFVTLGPSELASVYAGTTRVKELAMCDKVTGDSECIAMLDRLFILARPPFNSTRF